jgi:hypothetical protein
MMMFGPEGVEADSRLQKEKEQDTRSRAPTRAHGSSLKERPLSTSDLDLGGGTEQFETTSSFI